MKLIVSTFLVYKVKKCLLKSGKVTSKVYRNCSEFVHGNPRAIDQIGQNNEFSLVVTEKWNEFADTIIRCILYAFVMRYWKFLPENSKDIVRLRVEEEFSTTDILKDFI